MMPYPGRRAKKAAIWTLATILIFLTVIGGILPIMPELVNTLFPASQSSPSIKSSKSPNLLSSGPGVPLPPGTIQYGSREGPVMGQVTDNKIPAKVVSTPEAYVYTTSYGQYSFSHSEPFVFSLTSSSGEKLTNGSYFFIDQASLAPGLANVTVAADSQYSVRYEVLQGQTVVGYLTLKVEFPATTTPKFSVELSKTASWPFAKYQISWNTIPVSRWARVGNGPHAVDISQMATMPGLASSHRLEIGPSQDASSWDQWLTTDWSDAPGGSAAIGDASFATLHGQGLKVVFPSNTDSIDPTQVSTSAASSATGFSTQRKTFSYGGYYFLFWFDGSNIVYAASPNGLTWSPVASTGSGLVSSGFDLYNFGSTVAIAWLKYDPSSYGDHATQLQFLKGAVVGNSINWDPIRFVASLPQPYSWPPSVAIGTDGSFWAGGIWFDSPTSSHYYIWIYRSTDGANFGSPSIQYSVSSPCTDSRNEALQLIPLPKGRLMALSSHWCDSTIRWLTWNPLAQGGPAWNGVQTFDLGLPTRTPKWDIMSAAATLDGQLELVFQRYVSSAYSIATVYYTNSTDQWTLESTLYNGLARYPTLTVDNLGNFFTYWMADSGGTLTYLKSAEKVRYQSWSLLSDPFGSGPMITNGGWLSTSRLSIKQIILGWTLTGGSGPFPVVFGSIPLPSGIASSPPSQPWNRIGLPSTAPAGEYVSPGNGLLTIAQTDLVAPGRNQLSLSISRIYEEPFTFLQGVPFNYETSPYANLGYGWQLNLPWVGSQDLHYLNGRSIPIIWTDTNSSWRDSNNLYVTNSMQVHDTEDLVFSITAHYVIQWFCFIFCIPIPILNDWSYRAVTKDGTFYNFNQVGELTNIVDKTGQNQIIFNYNGFTLSSITDSVGRAAAFTYDGSGRLSSVAYAGQTVRYSYSGGNLASATDAVNRAITFSYNAQNAWLVSGITYPSGGSSSYTYGSVNIGTDAVNYYVTLQNLYASTLVKSTSFSYQITDGSVTYTTITQSDGSSVQGYTTNQYNAQARSTTTATLDANMVQLKKTVSWYDAGGKTVQQDVYNGNSGTSSFYTRSSYDNWGNMIYYRDPSGHESFQSFMNTNTQDMFQGLGNLTTTTSGKVFYDDFNSPLLDSTAWAKGGSESGISTTTASSLLTLQGASSNGGWQTDWVRTSLGSNYPFYIETQMSLGANPSQLSLDAELVLSPQLTASNGNPFQNPDALRLILNDGPYYRVATNVGGVTTVWYDSGFTPGGSTSVSWKVVLVNQNTISVYLNRGSGYNWVCCSGSIGLSSAFAPAYAYIEETNRNTAGYSASFDYLGLSGSNTIPFNGLQNQQKVEIYDSSDVLQASGTASGSGTVSLDVTNMVFPYGYAKIYEADGRTVQYTSPTRNVWGGDTYTYTSPKRSGGITRTTTGFLNSSTVYVDDSYPSGVYYSENGDYWDVTGQPYAPVVSGSNSHVGASVSGEHQHWFQEAYPSISTPSGYFHVQYVYIPWYSVPSEIMLQFQDNEVSNAGFETCDFSAWSQSGMIIRGDYKHTGRCAAAPSYNGGTGVYSAYTLYQTFPAIAGSRVTAVQLWYIWGSGDTAYVLYSDGSSTATSLPYVGSMTLKNLGWDSTKQITGIEVIRPTGTGTNIVLDDIGVRAGVGTTSGVDWEHRAYWGANDIGWGTDGTGSRRNMGPIPAATNNWLELIVKTDDVGTNGLKVDGLAYTLYDGGVTWDYSALGGPLTGTVTIGGLSPGQRVELYDQNGALKTSATVSTGSTSAGLDAYGAGINVFPFSGYIKVYATSGSLLYSSPLMKDIWGGDVYTFNGLTFSNAFNPGPVGVTIHDAVIGQAQYQKQNSVPEESYSKYDAFANLLQATQLHNGSPITSSYTYDQYGNVLSSTNANNQVENYAYSATYRSAYLTNVTQVLGGGVGAVTSFVYDFPTGNKIAVIDPLGNRTDYSYDAIGRPKVVRYPAVNGVRSTVNTFYGDTQNSIDVQNEKGNYTRTNFDGLGRKVTVKHYAGSNSSNILSIESYAYDWNNQVKTYTAPDGNVTSYSYDSLGRLTKVTNPDNTYRTFSYDNVNLVQSNLDENQHRTDYVYNNVQRLVQVREYYSPTSYYTTSYTYDALGNLLSTLDAKGQSVTYSYDDMNRPVLTTYPDQGSVTRTYDNIGNIATKKDPNGNTITYTYDNLNRLTQISYPDSTTATFSYDKNGNRLSMSNAASSATFAYDARNRLTKESWSIAGSNYVVGYGYDSVGNLVGITYPDNTKATYSVDALNRVTSVSVAGTTDATLTYGKNLKVSGIAYANSVVTNYDYDKRGRPTRIKVNYFSNTLLDLSYSYDNVGNVAGITGTSTETYSYDSLNRLTSSTGPWGTLGYGYDALGNRVWMTSGSTNTTYTYGTYDRLASVGTTTNTYDNNGALKTENMGGCNSNTFIYDYEYRLTSVANGCSGTLATYSYNPLGTKIQAVESGATTVYINRGLDVLYEKQISSGTITDYIFIGNQLIAKLSGSNTYFFHQDHLGSTRLVTIGKKTNFSTNYQPFGPQYGALFTDPVYKYTGKPQDSVTGLYYYGARWYDSTIGRFLSRDPKPGRLSDPQSLDPYVYARNNPLRIIDLTGMADCGFLNPLGCLENAGSAAVNAATSAGNWVVNEWNTDPNFRTGVIMTLATVAIVATAGLAAPALVPAIALGIGIGAATSSAAYVGVSVATGRQVTWSGLFAAAATGAFTGAIGGGAGGLATSIAAKGGSYALGFGILANGAGAAGGNVLAKAMDAAVNGKTYKPDPIAIAADFSLGAVTFGIGSKFVNSAAEDAAAGRVYGSLPPGQMTLDPYMPGSVVFDQYEMVTGLIKNSYDSGMLAAGTLMDVFV